MDGFTHWQFTLFAALLCSSESDDLCGEDDLKPWR